jgi:hypothetical protein
MYLVVGPTNPLGSSTEKNLNCQFYQDGWAKLFKHRKYCHRFTQPFNTLYVLVMVNPFIISLIILLLTSFSATAENMDELEFRKGFYYKNFSDVPFTGEVTGDWKGRLKNGKPEGE